MQKNKHITKNLCDTCNQKNIVKLDNTTLDYFTIRGGSLKKIQKKIIPRVPTSKKV